jgi:hypothetical protein
MASNAAFILLLRACVTTRRGTAPHRGEWNAWRGMRRMSVAGALAMSTAFACAGFGRNAGHRSIL